MVSAITTYQPDVIILNTAFARVTGFDGSIIMGKEDLLRALCADGLRRYIEAAESALAEHEDPWEAFAAFMHREVDADASSLTVRLAGTFTPTPALYEAAARAGELNVAIFTRAQEAGAIRPDASVNDLGPILEHVLMLAGQTF